MPGEVRTALSSNSAQRTVATSVGLARVHLSGRGKRLLALGHGAGGGVDALDLVAAKDAAEQVGWRVALIEQPWRVRGARVAEAPKRLDQAWLEVLRDVTGTLEAEPLVVGGRSAGARVACRTAEQTGAAGVLCLAFPLHPPGRPDVTRLPELEQVRVPLLVVQGSRDPFGVPPGAALVDGADHGFKVPKSLPPAGEQIRALVSDWLQSQELC